MEITSLGQLIDIIEKLCADRNYLLWFRGHADKEWDLIPSIQRENYWENERYLSNDFYMRASVTLKDKPNYDNYVGWTALMQHYGLPTRLLDWSRSPLVAAFFATDDRNEDSNKDACIWVLRPGLLNEYEFSESIIFPMDCMTIREMIYPA